MPNRLRLPCLALLGCLIALPAARATGPDPCVPFPAATRHEERFREARAVEAGDPGRAVERYRALLAEGFRPADAVHAALGRVLPPEDAEPHWLAVAAADPESPYLPEALEALAARRRAQGRLVEAEGLYRRLAGTADREERAVAAWLAVIDLLERRGEGHEAVVVAERVWVEFAHRPESRGAEPVLARAGEGDPLGPVPGERILERGQGLLERGRRDEAVRLLAGLKRRLVPGSRIAPAVDLALGKALYFLRRYPEALEPLGAAARWPQAEEEARFYRARCLFGLDRGDEGAADLLALARQKPSSPRAPLYLYQAARVFEGRGLERLARAARERLAAGHPRSDEARELRFGQGWELLRAGHPGDAAEAFRDSARGRGRDWLRARGLYWEARALGDAGREGEAAGVRETLRAEFPLGYYARVTEAPDRVLVDPRTADVRALPVFGPRPEDLRPADPTLARAAAYLRLGLGEPARRVLRAGGGANPGWAPYFYWSGDPRGAIRAAGRSWLDWPAGAAPAPLSPEGLAFPVGFAATASRAARAAGIHPHLLLAVAHTESHFDPDGYSPWEARGLMQFIPSTGRAVARAAGLERFEPEDLFDPDTALALGARHLRDLLDRFDGDAVAAIAAYNAGAAAVGRWLRQRPRRPTDAFVEGIPYRETRRYVKKVITALDAYGRLDPPGLVSGGPAP